MTRFIVVAITVALGGMACTGDPTASLRGGPAGISITPTTLYAFDDSVAQKIEIVVRDAQLNALAVPVTVASSDVAVFTVVPDALPEANGDRHVYFVTPLGAGQAVLRIEGGGVRDSATVNVLPQAFGGSGSPAAPQVGQLFTLYATNVLKFGPESKLAFGVRTTPDGTVPNYGVIVNQHADSLTVIVPQPDETQPAPLSVEEVLVTYVTGLQATLPTASLFNVGNPYDPNSGCAPAYVLPIPASGGPDAVLYDGFKESEVDNYYTITLAAATTFTLRLEWDTDADLDILWRNAGCTGYVGNFAGATGANPESSTVTLGPGTFNLWINAYDNHDEPAHLYKITVHTP